ncbi:alpha/beta hydrolase family protein [Paenibacillus sp. GCM10027628]|uniref:alpha/beta hydrolase family protein n=1 Tax=Paenibacillus sp. GCM10027628 TaxID=3273413 RepID=UPI003626BD7A
MRIFEIMLLVSNLVAWIVDGWIRRKAVRLAGCLAVAGMALLHFIFEGYRWQMIPFYVLTAGYMLYLWVKARRHNKPSKRSSSIRRFLLPFLLAVSAVLPILIPVFKIDSPSGPYSVGTVTYHWIDASREETMTDTPDDRRELLVQLWYPAQNKLGDSKALYIPEYRQLGQVLQQDYNIPAFMTHYLRLVQTNAYANAPLSAEQAAYPLIVFSHGLPGARFTSTTQMEELASHGYLVAAIQHSYFAMTTIFPDQRVAPKTKKLPSVIDIDGWDQLIEVWVKDAQFVLDQFERLNKQDPQGLLTGRINLDQIGMLGHSFGGAATIQTLNADHRLKAGINMDGTHFGKPVVNGLKQPFMLMKTEAEATSKDLEPNEQQLAQIGVTKQAYDKYKTEIPLRNRALFGNGRGYEVTIRGIKHMSFTDYYLWSPALRLMDGLQLSPMQARHVINRYVLAFFDTYLKQMPTALLDEPVPPFKEVTVMKK